MKRLSKEQYREKVYGCWLGKNIGGTLGAPFEATRSAVDISFYTTDLARGSIPNDDLDLQLAWLSAAERFGSGVNGRILAEYWVSAITPNWAEYGVGKANLRLGLEPPLSGGFMNEFRNSNGAWIRSELWACLMPGHPERAVKYAYEDASVDHADEGVYAEVFTAALESAAFAESDPERLIEIALSYIPADCWVARAVRLVRELRESGLTWKEARLRLLTEIPDSFGAQLGAPNPDGLPRAPWGFDAPANIGIVVLAWLYGEGDFDRTVCIAAGCGEDGDCTTATVGALLGIIRGKGGIPQRWIEPIGDEINTCSLNVHCDLISIPRTLTELTERTCSLMPAFMNGCFNLFAAGAEVALLSGAELDNQPRMRYMVKGYDFLREYPASFACFKGENAVMRVWLTTEKGVRVREGDEVELAFAAENLTGFIGNQLWLETRWLLPEGWTAENGGRGALFLNQYHCGTGNAEARLKLTVGPITAPRMTAVLEVAAHDRPGKIYVPVEFIAALS